MSSFHDLGTSHYTHDMEILRISPERDWLRSEIGNV